MKKLKGGVAAEAGAVCHENMYCIYYEANTGYVRGTCEHNSNHKCVCNAGTSSVVYDCCTVGADGCVIITIET